MSILEGIEIPVSSEEISDLIDDIRYEGLAMMRELHEFKVDSDLGLDIDYDRKISVQFEYNKNQLQIDKLRRIRDRSLKKEQSEIKSQNKIKNKEKREASEKRKEEKRRKHLSRVEIEKSCLRRSIKQNLDESLYLVIVKEAERMSNQEFHEQGLAINGRI